MTVADAIQRMEDLMTADEELARDDVFVNAHTLNCAYEEPAYRAVLNRASCVFGDGTGVRWAARLQGVRLKANLNGTDLMPAFMEATGGRGYRYYMLGTTPETMERCVQQATSRFTGWELAGYHHGYLDREREAAVLAEIRQLKPDLLMVGMGNPNQEQWIDRHRVELGAAVRRGWRAVQFLERRRPAPGWLRHLGHEWLAVVMLQPHKWRRYLLGNPKYLLRIACERGTCRP